MNLSTLDNPETEFEVRARKLVTAQDKKKWPKLKGGSSGDMAVCSRLSISYLDLWK